MVIVTFRYYCFCQLVNTKNVYPKKEYGRNQNIGTIKIVFFELKKMVKKLKRH